jgi:hypothetical protein
MIEPKISFVVAARNDNYGGNFLHRLQVFLKCLLILWKRYELNSELIIVEWNPPGGASRLAEVLKRPSAVPKNRIRIIEVPHALHRRIANSDRIALFEYIAKNVGIRRAKGQYVLATNPDIIFSRELIRFLASEDLSSDCFYRIDRYDVGMEVPLKMPVDEQLRFCTKNSICVRSTIGTIPLKYLSFKRYKILRGYLRKLFSPWDAIRWFTMKFIFKIHTGASGDFTLMDRRSWHGLRGYPELPTQTTVDYYLCSMAKSSGLYQVVFKNPLRIYHQPHGLSGMAGQSIAEHKLFWQDIKGMIRSGNPLILNDESWGLGNEQLQESAIM